MFDEARHAADIRARMARSTFAGLLDGEQDERKVITHPAAASANSGALIRPSDGGDPLVKLTRS